MRPKNKVRRSVMEIQTSHSEVDLGYFIKLYKKIDEQFCDFAIEESEGSKIDCRDHRFYEIRRS